MKYLLEKVNQIKKYTNNIKEKVVQKSKENSELKEDEFEEIAKWNMFWGKRK